MKTVVIYHDKCTDGLTAAACFTNYWKSFSLRSEELHLFAYTIERGFPLDKVQALTDVEKIYCVDCAPPNLEMLAGLSVIVGPKNLIILDHHKTNIEFLETQTTYYNRFDSELDMTRSGAGIAWDFLFGKDTRPMMINWVEDRDLWNYNYPDTKAFFYGMGTRPNTLEYFTDAVGGMLVLGKVVDAGRAIEEYVNGRIEATVKSNTLHSTISGHPCVLVNCTDNMSDVCNRLLELHPEKQIAIAYYHIPGFNEFKVSMRSRKGGTDVGAICSSFEKGGGHQPAAACVMKPEVFNSTFNIGKYNEKK